MLKEKVIEKLQNYLVASVLCLLMVVFCVVGLTACGGDDECSHKWGEWTATTNATCTEAGVQERKCSECGETETSAIKALGHDWNEATCSTPKTCKTCSATEGTANAHAYTVETVKDEALKSAANCTSAAVYYKSCSCGAISTNDADTFTSGAALEHKDENTDHVCDYNCGKNDMGTHADENKDHACDYGCSTTFGEHSDSNADNDHVCDYGCEAVLENCSDAENDGNHTCDICGNADISTHTYFNERFGRSDFEEVYNRSFLGQCVAYLVKYLEKTGEKLVYSKGLPQYFVSDILDDDIVCTMGADNQKLLLFDDFKCFDDGTYMGQVSKEVIAQMPKEN